MFGALHHTRVLQQQQAQKRKAAQSKPASKSRRQNLQQEPFFTTESVPVANPSKFRVPGWVHNGEFVLAASIIKEVYNNGYTRIGYNKAIEDHPTPMFVVFDPDSNRLVDLKPLIDERQRAINLRRNMLLKAYNEAPPKKADRGILGYVRNCVGSLCSTRRRNGGRRVTRRKNY